MDRRVHIWAGRIFNDCDWIVGQVGLCGARGDIQTTDWIDHTTCYECREMKGKK